MNTNKNNEISGKERRKRGRTVVPLFLAAFGLWLVVFYGFMRWQEKQTALWKESFRAEVMADVRRQILNEVREELRPQLAAEIRSQVRADLEKEVMALSRLRDQLEQVRNQKERLAWQSSHSPESKREAIRQVIDEILRRGRAASVSDEELDQVVASGPIESSLPVGGGFQKSPVRSEFELAAARDSGHVTLSSGSSDASGGLSSEDLQETGGKEHVESIERTLQQKGSILLPKGTLQIEPSTTWAHFSSNRIFIQGFSVLPVLVVGQISTETVKRDVFIENVSLKYGLWHNVQAEVRVPFRWEKDRITDTFNNESTRTAGGLGDIEFGVSRQIGWEHGLMPDLIAGITFKTKSGRSPYNRQIGLGTGHYAVRGALVIAKSSDPAVIFGNVSFTHNFKRDVVNFGEMKPGDTISYSLGAAIALSYQTAINFSFDHSVTFKTMQNKRVIHGSFLNVANFNAGFNWALNEKSSIDFSVGIGLTTDSPDVTVTFRFPHIF